jgi:hypothetical protein
VIDNITSFIVGDLHGIDDFLNLDFG